MEEKEKGKQYQVEFTQSSKVYFYEVLEYLYDHYPLERAEEIATELESTAQSLKDQPHRGSPEKRLSHKSQAYKFILYQRTSRAQIKIIYYIEEQSGIVYVTDFFPTEKDYSEISKRS